MCVAHRLQNAVKSAVEKQSMQKLLGKCRHLVSHFKHSALASDNLGKKQKVLGFKKPLRVIQEVATRWNSTFHMLQRLVVLKQPIRLYLEDAMNETDQKSYDLTDSQWSVVKGLLSILEAVDQVTITLSGKKYSTLSWCLPLLFGLRDAAKQEENDSTTLSGIKRKLTDQLNQRFKLNNLEMSSALVLAAALDPRFRKLSFLSKSEQDKLQRILLQKASNVDCTVTTDDRGEPPVKKRPSVLDRLLGEDKDIEEDDEAVSTLEEIKMYFQERPIKRKEDPLFWWRGNASRFPHLAVLAQKYLGIPATSTPSERVFSVAGIVVDKRRCALTAEMINALVFLHKNSHLLGMTEEILGPAEPELILQPKDRDVQDVSEEEDEVVDLEANSGSDEDTDDNDSSD